MTGLDSFDMAKVDGCPGCGVPARRFSAVPISGTGLDLHFSGPWWCDPCIHARTYAACHGVTVDEALSLLRSVVVALLGG